jgi:hypothetical protein
MNSIGRWCPFIVLGVTATVVWAGPPAEPVVKQLLDQGLPAISRDGSELCFRVTNSRKVGFSSSSYPGTDVLFLKTSARPPDNLVQYPESGRHSKDLRELETRLKRGGFRALALEKPVGDTLFNGNPPPPAKGKTKAERILKFDERSTAKRAGSFKAGALQVQVSLREVKAKEPGEGFEGLTRQDDAELRVLDGDRVLGTAKVSLIRMQVLEVTGVVVLRPAKLVFVRLTRRTALVGVHSPGSVEEELWLRAALSAPPRSK